MQRSVDHSHDVALHESRHAAYAAHRGLEVLGVRVGGWDGCTDVRLPVEPAQVQQAWDVDPRMALDDMHAIVGTLIAPVAAEGKLFRANADDAALLGRYARAWSRLRPSRATGEHAPAWLDVLADVRREVWRWAKGPGALLAVYELAYWLQREEMVGAEGWRWLWAQPFAKPLHQARTAPAAIRTAAAVQRPRPAGAAKSRAQRALSDFEAFYGLSQSATAPKRSTPDAEQKHRPQGQFPYFQPRFFRPRLVA